MEKKENSFKKAIKEFERINSLGYRDLLSRFKNERVLIGLFCPYVPVELIHASGALPLRLIGVSPPMSHVHPHLPNHCCYLVRSSLESLLRGELNEIKYIIFTHTCDSMQGFSEIWAFQKKLPRPYHFMMPTRLGGEESKIFLRSEIERLKTFLDSEVGEVDFFCLKRSIKLFNRIREKVERLYNQKKSTSSLSEKNFAEILRASCLMEPEDFLEHLESLLSSLAGEGGKEKEGRVPILVTGNMVHSPSYFSLIEEAGGEVVWDNLCSGARWLKLKTREEGDSIEALTERYFSLYLCPTKHRGAEDPLTSILKEVENYGAKGVLFLLYKYCESHFFDYPDLKEELESKGIPSLLIEVDDPSASSGQVKTRIQAFLEMLKPF